MSRASRGARWALRVAIAAVLAVLLAGCGSPEDGQGATTAPSPGQRRARPRDGVEMVYVPAGSFWMGSAEGEPLAETDELPRHEVTLDGFWIDRVEVTNARFVAFLNEAGNSGENGVRYIELNEGYARIRQGEDGSFSTTAAAADHAVVMVSWHGADAYCRWAGARLPTEAEWEYAARGEDGRWYPWGDGSPDCERTQAHGCSSAAAKVGALPEGASWCGVLDMAGNVWEWVADRYGPYASEAVHSPMGPEEGVLRVTHGGGWHASEQELRCAYRLESAPGSHVGCVGFRCAATTAP